MDMFAMLPQQNIIFLKIFCYLSLEDIFRMRRVAPNWNSLVMEYFNSRYVIDLRKLKTKMSSSAFQLMTQNNQHFNFVFLNNAYWLKNEFLIPVINRCNNISVIDLTNCSVLGNETIRALAENYKSLQEICLENCHWLEKEYFKQLVMNNRQLNKLNLSSCWLLDDESVTVAVESCVNLKQLNISNIFTLTDRALRSVARNCFHLNSLSVRGCSGVTDAGISEVGECCKNLRKLNVSFCGQVSEDSLSQLRIQGINIDVSALKDNTMQTVFYHLFDSARTQPHHIHDPRPSASAIAELLSKKD